METLKPSVSLAMKTVAGGKVTYVMLADGRLLWLDRNGDVLPRRGYETMRQKGWIRMEELGDKPEGVQKWYRVLLSLEGRKVWMPERLPEGAGLGDGQKA